MIWAVNFTLHVRTYCQQLTIDNGMNDKTWIGAKINATTCTYTSDVKRLSHTTTDTTHD